MLASQIIVWDVDDVLNRLMYCWLDNWNRGKSHPIGYNQIDKNPPHGILGISKKDYLINLDEFRISKYNTEGLINKVLLNWFQNYGDNFIHIGCTARTIQTMPYQSWKKKKTFII